MMPGTIVETPAPVATATVVVPEPKAERFVTAPGRWTSEFWVTVGAIALEFGMQAVEVATKENVDTSAGWITAAVYVVGRTLVKMADAMRKSPTVVVAKK
jgi:hypothetical protein